MQDFLHSPVTYLQPFEDVINVWQTEGSTCFMKLFPLCGVDSEVPEEDWGRFHLRFYLPSEVLLDARRSVDQFRFLVHHELSHAGQIAVLKKSRSP